MSALEPIPQTSVQLMAPEASTSPVKPARGGLDPIKAARPALAVRESIAAIAADDDELLADMIEGETDLFEIIDRLLARRAETLGLAAGLQTTIDDLKARQERFEKRAATDRTLIEQALTIAGTPTVQRPVATLTMARRSPQLVIDEAADIPADYWKPGDPKLDRAALKAALEGRAAEIELARQLAQSAHEDDPDAATAAFSRATANLGPIPGAHLEAAPPSLTIRSK